jgi:hypothetical protein
VAEDRRAVQERLVLVALEVPVRVISVLVVMATPVNQEQILM